MEGFRYVFGRSWSWEKCSWSRRDHRGKFLGVFESAQACTGLPDLVDRSSQVSEVSVLRVPVYQNWTDRSSIVREGRFSACTGLPDLVDRSSKVSRLKV